MPDADAGENVPRLGESAVVINVDDIFAEGKTRGSDGSPGASNASLDLETLATELKSVTPPGHKLSVRDTSVESTGTTVLYDLGPATEDESAHELNAYAIEIHHASSAVKASDLMKDFLRGIENINVDSRQPVVRPVADAPLGDYALRTEDGVFWIRGESIYINIIHEVVQLSEDPGKAPDILTSKSSIIHSVADAFAADPTGHEEPNEDDPVPIQDDHSVIEIAQIIDKLLAQHWTKDASQQIKPHPQLASSTPVRAKSGDVFTVELRNLQDTLEIKPAEAADENVAVATENGTADGFKFFALEAGRTKLHLRVAHAKTLAVAEVVADLVVD
jgi:hypothetical protein